jgi:hypothetical protein
VLPVLAASSFLGALGVSFLACLAKPTLIASDMSMPSLLRAVPVKAHLQPVEYGRAGGLDVNTKNTDAPTSFFTILVFLSGHAPWADILHDVRDLVCSTRRLVLCMCGGGSTGRPGG